MAALKMFWMDNSNSNTLSGVHTDPDRPVKLPDQDIEYFLTRNQEARDGFNDMMADATRPTSATDPQDPLDPFYDVTLLFADEKERLTDLVNSFPLMIDNVLFSPQDVQDRFMQVMNRQGVRTHVPRPGGGGGRR